MRSGVEIAVVFYSSHFRYRIVFLKHFRYRIVFLKRALNQVLMISLSSFDFNKGHQKMKFCFFTSFVLEVWGRAEKEVAVNKENLQFHYTIINAAKAFYSPNERISYCKIHSENYKDSCFRQSCHVNISLETISFLCSVQALKLTSEKVVTSYNILVTELIPSKIFF